LVVDNSHLILIGVLRLLVILNEVIADLLTYALNVSVVFLGISLEFKDIL
jgi:hypothetical protein